MKKLKTLINEKNSKNKKIRNIKKSKQILLKIEKNKKKNLFPQYYSHRFYKYQDWQCIIIDSFRRHVKKE